MFCGENVSQTITLCMLLLFEIISGISRSYSFNYCIALPYSVSIRSTEARFRQQLLCCIIINIVDFNSTFAEHIRATEGAVRMQDRNALLKWQLHVGGTLA